MNPRLTGVGVGPGDPELLTVKAVRLLQRVAWVFYPVAAPGAESMALRIAQGYLDPARQELVPLIYPFGRGPAEEEAAWAANGRAIALRLGRDGHGAFLTEGDALLYSTFLYTAEGFRRAAPEAEIGVIPGIPSFVAAAAVTRVSLGRRSDRVAIVTGGTGVEDALASHEGVVILKASRDWEGTLAALRRCGRSGEAVAVTRCGWPEERIEWDVEALSGRRLDYFTLLLVGRWHL